MTPYDIGTLVEDVLDELNAIVVRFRRWRHRRRVVLWGGRPGRDVWVGSREDLRRQELLNSLTALRFAWRHLLNTRLAAIAAAWRRAFDAVGTNLEDVERRRELDRARPRP